MIDDVFILMLLGASVGLNIYFFVIVRRNDRDKLLNVLQQLHIYTRLVEDQDKKIQQLETDLCQTIQRTNAIIKQFKK